METYLKREVIVTGNSDRIVGFRRVYSLASLNCWGIGQKVQIPPTERLCQKSELGGMESVPPRGSGWVRSPSVWISLKEPVLKESFGFAPTRYREVVLTPSHRALSFDTVSESVDCFQILPTRPITKDCFAPANKVEEPIAGSFAGAKDRAGNCLWAKSE